MISLARQPVGIKAERNRRDFVNRAYALRADSAIRSLSGTGQSS